MIYLIQTFLKLFLPLVIAGPSAPPSDSLYHLKGKWASTSGSTQGLKDMRGRPVVLSMIYTRCKASCPLTIAKMKELEAAAGKGDYVFAMASFDPKNDTAPALKKYLADRKLDPAHWQMLSPNADRDARELAAATGVVYSRDEQGEYSHSNVVVLLDREGVIQAKLESLSAETTDFVKKLKELSRAR